MAREILFKAKRKDNGEWVEGLPAIFWEEYYMFNPNDKNMAYGIDIDTLCQYTGLTDKNGNKIWEHDIIKCGIKMYVFWDEHFASWCLTRKGWLYKHFFGESQEPEDCEVIGNIFDNPELLEDEHG
ncbi:MAG: hypothetical protein J6B94_08515 [Lachnospiraceae bacterium]|nr:hypothetical protein [Lachnospiraceae bacterium]